MIYRSFQEFVERANFGPFLYPKLQTDEANPGVACRVDSGDSSLVVHLPIGTVLLYSNLRITLMATLDWY